MDNHFVNICSLFTLAISLQLAMSSLMVLPRLAQTKSRTITGEVCVVSRVRYEQQVPFLILLPTLGSFTKSL
jgi:hypothetical protein